MKLTENIIKMIEFDLSCGPQFVAICKQFWAEESAQFLLAVVRYKKNPTLPACEAIFNTYLKKGAPSEINIGSKLPEDVGLYIDNMHKRMKVSGKTPLIGTMYTRPLPASPKALDESFTAVLRLINSKFSEPGSVGGRTFGKSMDQFGDMFNLQRFDGAGTAATM